MKPKTIPVIHKKGASFSADIFTLCGRLCMEKYFDDVKGPYWYTRLNATEDISLVTCKICKLVYRKQNEIIQTPT